MKSLPTEIWINIIDNLVSPFSHHLALSPNHDVTRALSNLSLTSKTLSCIAQPHLLRHCVYIDSPERLDQLLWSLDQASPQQNQQWRPSTTAVAVEKMFLSPFPEDTIDNRRVADAVANLLDQSKHSLRRLMVDIPFRSCYSPDEDSHGSRSVLRSALHQLSNLQEFISVRDELYLDPVARMQGKPIEWSKWPQLERLALYNLDLDDRRVAPGIMQLPKLQTLVLTRSDGIPEGIFRLPGFVPFEVFLVNTAAEHAQNIGQMPLFHEVPPLDKRKFFSGYKVSVPLPSYVDEDHVDDPELCQSWVLDRALTGSLWTRPHDSPMLWAVSVNPDMSSLHASSREGNRPAIMWPDLAP